MKCNHDVMHLVGTSEGITCRMCGMTFASFKELMADRKAEKVTEEATETEQTEEEKPKKQAAKKKRG